MKNKLVYGILGSKGHGKDTLADAIVDADDRFRIVHFADKLKEITKCIFDLKDSDVNTQEGKERPFSCVINIDDYLPSLSEQTGLELTPLSLVARSPRELLQYIGSEYIRGVKDSYWRDQVQKFISEHPRVVVPDVRFRNEAAMIKKEGGILLRVVRTDLPTSSDLHISEVEGNLVKEDYLIRTITGELEYVKNIGLLLAEGRLPIN